MRVNHFPAFPGTLRAYYGPYESLITFQCQVVENEASAQTDGPLALPPVLHHQLIGKNPSRYLRGFRPLKGTALRAGPRWWLYSR